MAEKVKCEHCDQEFKTAQALGSHVRSKHPETLQQKPEPPKVVPDVVYDFELLLKDYGIKKADLIAKHIADTGSPNVFDKPKELAGKLVMWPRDIANVYRATILEHWFKRKGITIPQELIEEASMEPEDKEKMVKGKKAEKKVAEGAVWTVDVDDSGMPSIRMIKDATEPGVTLAEAKTAAKEIGKEREEPIVIYNEAQGKHLPNFKSSFVRQNLPAAWATAKQMDKAVAEGEAADPMDIWIDQQSKLTQLKEALGVSPEAKEKGTISELVSALKDLQEMAKGGEVSELPGWMTDPAKFIETVKTVTAAGEAGGKPDWLSDPAAFIKTIREITGEEGKGDEAVKSELAELRKALETMQDERHKEEISALQTQITEQAKTHEKHMQAVLEKMEELKKPTTGKTEMDILHEIATEGIGVLRTELPGFRKDIKEAMGSTVLPPGKSAEERKERTSKLRQAVETDKDIEELGRRLFFREG